VQCKHWFAIHHNLNLLHPYFSFLLVSLSSRSRGLSIRFYVTFSKITRPRIKVELPGLLRGELNRELGRRWRELSDEAKRQWVPSLVQGRGGAGGAAANGAATQLHADETDDDEEEEEEEEDASQEALPACAVGAPVVEM